MINKKRSTTFFEFQNVEIRGSAAVGRWASTTIELWFKSCVRDGVIDWIL